MRTERNMYADCSLKAKYSSKVVDMDFNIC